MHVTKLQEDVADIKIQLAHVKASFGARPFIPKAAEAESHRDSADAGRGNTAPEPARHAMLRACRSR